MAEGLATLVRSQKEEPPWTRVSYAFSQLPN
jgi:hypothetical protein